MIVGVFQHLLHKTGKVVHGKLALNTAFVQVKYVPNILFSCLFIKTPHFNKQIVFTNF